MFLFFFLKKGPVINQYLVSDSQTLYLTHTICAHRYSSSVLRSTTAYDSDDLNVIYRYTILVI